MGLLLCLFVLSLGTFRYEGFKVRSGFRDTGAASASDDLFYVGLCGQLLNPKLEIPLDAAFDAMHSLGSLYIHGSRLVASVFVYDSVATLLPSVVGICANEWTKWGRILKEITICGCDVGTLFIVTT